MPERDTCNLEYFECSSMRVLHHTMEDWQDASHKRVLSLSIK
jgi:hypothetical protein